MTDKELIKQEIERRVNLLQNGDAAPEVMKRVEGVLLAYNSILQLMDSLPEEPASEDLDEEIEIWIKKKHFIFTEISEVIETAHHFAEWQKQKDQETIELAEDHAMLAGMMKEREEIMKDAVIAWVNTYESVTNPYDNEVSFITNLSPSKFKNKEKVKIIIIKEE